MGQGPNAGATVSNSRLVFATAEHQDKDRIERYQKVSRSAVILSNQFAVLS